MNASSLQKFSDRAAQTGEALWPATVMIGNVNYAAECPRPAREKVGLEPGYEEVLDTRVVRIRKTLLAQPPALNSFVTMDGKRWQIRSIGGENAANASWVFSIERKK